MRNSESKAFVFISNNGIGLHCDRLPSSIKAASGGGEAWVFEESRHPYGNTDNEVRALEDVTGFPLAEADGIVIYVERGAFGAIVNLASAGVAGERVTYVTCKCYAYEVAQLLKESGQGAAELIILDQCGCAIGMGQMLAHFIYDLRIHD
jgi:hypothetical protein